MGHLIMVSNRLPVSIVSDHGTLRLQRSLGGLATALNSVSSEFAADWVGWAGNPKPLTDEKLRALALPDNLLPVQLAAQDFTRYYDQLANGVLWPMFHGMPPRHHATNADWEALDRVMTRFADVVTARCKTGDTIWIHDYHLMLLMHVLRKRDVTNRIGFFLHTPFPAFSSFGELPQAKALLGSMTQADVVGFQTPEDKQNFLDSAKRAGVPIAPSTIVGTFPIGVDADLYASADQSPAVQQQLTAVQQIIDGRRLVFSVSRLDYTKGIVEQIRGFAEAVLRYKLERVLYRLVVAPSREARVEYRQLEQRIAREVAKANQQFASQGLDAAIMYEYRGHNFDELNAWYRLADVLLITPRIDGMNLVVKEYIAARRMPGAVVLTATAGAARQLTTALHVPPDNVAAISAALYDALHMPAPERETRWAALRDNVFRYDLHHWAASFIAALQS